MDWKQNKALMLIISCIIMAAVGYAASNIGTSISTGALTATSVDTDNLNDIQLVDAGSFSDIATKITAAGVGGTVIIPCGDYTVTSDINVLTNQTIRGMGECTKLTLAGNYNFQSAGIVDNVEISDLYVDCDYTGSRPFDFSGNNNLDLEFRNIHITDCSDRGFHLKGGYVWIDQVYCENCFKGVGLVSSGGDEVIKITNSVFISTWNKTGSEYGEGIDLNEHNWGTALIEGNYLSGYREQAIECNLHDCIIKNNHVIDPGADTRPYQAILVGTSSVEGNVAVVEGNIIEGLRYNSTGIQVHYNLHATVSGNQIYGDLKDTSIGIRLLGNTDKHATVQGNLIADVATGIYDANADVGDSFIGNTFVNCTTNYTNNSGSNYNFIGQGLMNQLMEEVTFRNLIHIGTDSGSNNYLIDVFETGNFNGDAQMRLRTTSDDAKIVLDAFDDAVINYDEDGTGKWIVGHDKGANYFKFYGQEFAGNTIQIQDATGYIEIKKTNTGGNAGTNLCIGASDEICRCGSCS